MAAAGRMKSTDPAATHLWHFPVSLYSEKVRWALDHKRWPHVRTALVPGFHIPVARWVSGQSQLPILKVDGRVIAGSASILEEIERLAPERPLFPTEPEARARALGIQAFFDTVVAPEFRRLFWSTYLDRPAECARIAADGSSDVIRVGWEFLLPVMRPLLRSNMGLDEEQVGAARSRMHSHFDRLASEIGPSGYLVGDYFGVADLAAAATMTAIVRPPEYPYPLPEPWSPGLVSLRESVADHPAFQWVLDIYSRHRGK
jgi:glutathione S-transferase